MVELDTEIIWKWQQILGLENWKITVKAINKNQVVFDKAIPKEDRYFVGIAIDKVLYTGIIYHDRELLEEDILHELLHIKCVDIEEAINFLTKNLIFHNNK